MLPYLVGHVVDLALNFFLVAVLGESSEADEGFCSFNFPHDLLLFDTVEEDSRVVVMSVRIVFVFEST